MGLRETNTVRRRALGLLCACFILLVLGYLEAAWIDYYFFPTIIATPGRNYLIYRRNPQIGRTPSSYIHTSPDGISWSDAVYIPFDPGAGKIVGEELYALRGNHYSVYSLSPLLKEEKTDPWKRSASFGLGWRVDMAFLEGKDLRLVGTEDTGEGKVKIREAVTGEPAARELPHSVEIPRPEILAACVHEGTLYLLHRGPDEKTTHLLKREAGGEWQKAGEIPELLGVFDCACAAGNLHIVGSPAKRGEAGSWRLVHYTISADGAAKVPGELNHGLRNYIGTPRVVREISLAGNAESLYLAGRFGNVVATAVWRGGAWSAFTTVNKTPLGTKIVMWSWFFAVLAMCGALIFTGYHLYVAKRGRLRAGPEREPVPFEVAGLLRRAGAFAIDYLLINTVILIVAQPAQGVPGARSALDFLELDHPLILQLVFLAYFALPEMISGQTLGKGLLGITVKSQHGQRAGVWAVVLRNLFKLIWPLLVIEAMVLLSTESRRRLGDFAAGTVVANKNRQGR